MLWKHLPDEIAHHLQDMYDDLRARGVSDEAARRAVAAELDGITFDRPLSDIGGDVRYAFRALRKNVGFAAVVVLTLALGIGANAAIFSVVNAVVLRPLPYRDADRLVVIRDNLPASGLRDIVISAVEYLDYRARNHVFDEMAAYDTTAFNLTGRGEPERLDGAVTTASLLPILGASPALGRAFDETDNQAGRDRVALLSHALWQRRFAGDPRVVGTLITLEGRGVEVIGVMPPSFRFPDDSVELWMPIAFDADLVSENNRGSRSYTALGRLKPGVTIAQAQADMNAVTGTLVRDYREQYRGGFSTTVRGLQTDIVGDTGRGLFVLLGAVGVVLLIACANIANLLLVRAHGRRKEVAIRTALGANRARIVRQLLTESLVLAAIGGGCGLLVAVWGLDLLVAIAPADTPRLTEISLDRRVITFTAAVSMITGVFFGLAPALHAARVDLNETLKEGGRTPGSGGRHRARRLLVAAEVAMALVLLVAAGLLINSFARVQDVAPGFDASHLLTLRIAPPPATYSFAKSQQFFDELFERLRARPGIEGVGAVNALPFSGSGGDRTFYLEGRLNPRPEEKPDEQVRFASAGYFAAMKIPVRRGREFTARDSQDAPQVAIVNEALARKYWPDDDPIGKRLTFSRQDVKWYQIVGVAGNLKHRSLEIADVPEVYVPVAQPLFAGPSPRPMFLVVRTAGDPMTAAAEVREVVASIDPNQPVSNIRSMEQRIGASLGSRRFTMLLIGVFAALALVLASIGIYGVVAYTVRERSHEIGVRLALGAQPRNVVAMLVGQGMTLASGGAAAGIVLAVALTRVMTGLLFGVSATDPATFAVITAGLALVAIIACYLPARRATAVNPVTALRNE
ncbi:MAG TPA: ABC transporter permease [Vicinamibacterales bacterium]|nr:ABC transporter permease [Vicinamibacterales bacterium]